MLVFTYDVVNLISMLGPKLSVVQSASTFTTTN